MSDIEQFKNLVYVSIISADNDEFGLSEDDKQTIIMRRDISESIQKDGKLDWEWILFPIKDRDKRNKLIQLFEE